MPRHLFSLAYLITSLPIRSKIAPHKTDASAEREKWPTGACLGVCVCESAAGEECIV